MKPESLRQATHVLAAALNRPAHERAEFVRAECGHDLTLADEVLSLVDHYQQADSDGFLSAPAADADAMFDGLRLNADGSDSFAVATGVNVDELMQRIADSQISNNGEISKWLSELAPQQRPDSAQHLLTSLVELGKLTAYQAEILAKDTSEPLVLGNYEVLDRIAEGGMGRVFMARHRLMNRIVAVKLIADDAIDSPAAAKRFRREVETAAKLNHPNIVQAFDADLADGTHLLVMEFVDGMDLGRMVRRTGPLPLAQAVDYIMQAARGLAFAHQHRVVHRDVKPSNMLVDGENTLKILDMGLARLDAPVDHDSSATSDQLTQDDHFFGTIDYMAPEQATSARTADHRADIYSLGCTLYYLVTARPPYVAASPAAKIVAHREEPTPQLADSRDNVPAELDDLLFRMLAKQPDERVQSLDEVIHRLEALLPQLPDQEPRTDWADLPEPLPRTEHRDVGSHSTASFDAVSTDSLSIRPPADPLIARGASPQSQQKSWWPQLIAVLLLLAAGAVVYQLIILIPTSEGTLIVTFDDDVVPDDVVVQIDGEQVKVETTDDGKALTIGVDPGKRRLRIETKDGTQFYANNELEFSRGGTKLLTARLEHITTRRQSNDPPLEGGDHERELAEWLLGFNAMLRVRIVGGAEQTATEKGELPRKPFAVIGVDIHVRADFTNDDVARLRLLPHLTALNFHEVGVGDDCLEHIGSLRSLTHLYIKHCNLTGSTFSNITNLKQLEMLDIGGNPLIPSHLATLGQLPSLEDLRLENVGLDDDGLSYLQGVANLTHLDLVGNPINGSGLKSLGGLKRLATLMLESTHLDDNGLAIVAASFDDLTHLDMDGTRITDDGMAHLRHLQELEVLALYNNPQITDRGFEHLRRLPHLTNLDISNTSASSACVPSLSRLSELNSLSLSRTQVDDECIPTLSETKTLTNLDVRATAISAEGMAEIKKALPNCNIHWSSPTNVEPVDFDRERELAELVTSQVQSVWIVMADGKENPIEITDASQIPDDPFFVTRVYMSQSNSVNDVFLAHLRGMPKLKELFLVDSHVGDVGMKHVATMKNLRWLSAKRTYVTGLGVRHLAQLPNLEGLDIEGITLRDADMEWIPAHVKNLSIASTGVTKYGQLARLHQLQSLNVSGLTIDDQEIQSLIGKNALAELTILYMDKAQISDDAVVRLSRHLELKEWHLTSTFVSDMGVSEVWRQRKLWRLRLDQCPNVTDAAMAEIEKVLSLTELGLSDTNLTDLSIAHLSRMTSLTDLDIRHTRITQGGYEKLKQTLPNCKIEWSAEPPEFRDVAPVNGDTNSPAGHGASYEPNDTTRDRDLAEWILKLGGSVQVHRVDVPLPDGSQPKSISSIDELQSDPIHLLGIHVDHHATFRDEDVARLNNFRRLRWLTLRVLPITDAALPHIGTLTNLQSLSLGDTYVTGQGLRHLSGLSNLELLILNRTLVKDRDLEHIGKLTALRILWLEHTDISTLKPLFSLANLGQLWLKGCIRLDDDSIIGLDHLPNLYSLDLPDTSVGDAGFHWISQHMNLSGVDASRTQISDAGVLALCRMTGLGTLTIHNCSGVTNASVEHLLTRGNLKNLDIRGTKITDEGVARLKAGLPEYAQIKSGEFRQQ